MAARLNANNCAASFRLRPRHASETHQVFIGQVGYPMKKLPYCPLVAGVLFVVFGTHTLLQFTRLTEPFGLLFPLLWDLIMVAIGLGVILRCHVARKAGVAWGIFCLLSSVVIGLATVNWVLQPRGVPLGHDRVFFMFLAVAFGLLFGIWQWKVLQSPAARDWRRSEHHDPHPPFHKGTQQS